MRAVVVLALLGGTAMGQGKPGEIVLTDEQQKILVSAFEAVTATEKELQLAQARSEAARQTYLRLLAELKLTLGVKPGQELAVRDEGEGPNKRPRFYFTAPTKP